MVEPGRLTDSASLTRRLLWNRQVGEPAGPQPVVVLLGPTGSGKTEALNSISRDCGSGVVHNQPLDFAKEAPTTVEALAKVAFGLSRRWPSRKPPRFTRFALGLIAVQAVLPNDREQARAKIDRAIREFSRNPSAERIAQIVQELSDAAEPLFDPLLAATVNLLPTLIRHLGRKPLSNAKRWHADIPEAEGAGPLDALIQLSTRARADSAERTSWLTSAFLADVRESHPVLAKPEPKSPCACLNPARLPHLHNWVVLLDNVDHGSGFRFLEDITAARERHLRQHEEHDPLLVVATSGRWHPEWESDWHPPWKSVDSLPDDVSVVPRCPNTGHWRTDPAQQRPTAPYLPVLLEPLKIEETARILGTGVRSPAARLAQRASGGLPHAVHTIKALLDGRELDRQRRDVLWPDDLAEARSCQERLEELRLSHHLVDVGIEEFVTAAAWATAPWLVPAESAGLVSQPKIGRILTELRTALWVIAPERRGGTEDHTVMHPWIARTLLSALAARTGEPSYAAQFRAMLDDSSVRRDPERHAYCLLALGEFSTVVDVLEERFDRIPHQDWVDLLTLVTGAPDDKPLHLGHDALYQALVDEDLRGGTGDRSMVRNVLARLVAAAWLLANPLVGPDDERKRLVAQCFRELAPLSRRSDVAALYEAARQTERLF
ncbi:hypothetical protein SAMN02982929_02427 [Saccharopolyspora kobensis]|uniref:Uncharacterized protein n=1 Tax=Saccharopolyspora kobensis TaxID=146035 RepID=A0A1H6ARX2_9PSEU|nr:hypothetical protein [Saccharopolyspora kobensis]SEG50546.1 hypothetical protein SAMN02982929_02427 [Saccharopolyspora kobensis]SFE76145.1 hypothetical protein SAMN05216506_11435 [Saccharopolyspora kobensis]